MTFPQRSLSSIPIEKRAYPRYRDTTHYATRSTYLSASSAPWRLAGGPGAPTPADAEGLLNFLSTPLYGL